MSSPDESFAGTWRELGSGTLKKGGATTLSLVILFGGWLVWFFAARVSVYATSASMKIESMTLPLPVQPAVDGIVVACNIQLAQHVAKGDVLVRLDATSFELKKAESQATLAARLEDAKALETEIDAQLAARNAVADLVAKSEQSGRAKLNASRTAAHAKQEETKVVDQLGSKELASKLDQLRAEGESATGLANVTATAAMAAQDVSGNRATLSERDAQIAALRRTLVAVEHDADVIRANIASTDYEIELRSVRAASAGTLADIAPCAPGMTVAPSVRLATLLPDSKMRVVSMFTPHDAVGRVKPAQHAVLRIDNYPWTQFGTMGAVVQSVGSEPRDGLVRVELGIDRTNPMIPVTHGLTGQAEIEIERTSPFHLLLRAAGQWLTPDAPVAPQGNGSS